LIGAAGISGAGIGGAAALGLFKMADKLLQGEKFSSAAYQGAKTGGMAYAAGQIGQALKGTPQQGLPGAQGAPGSYQHGAGIGVTPDVSAGLSPLRKAAGQKAYDAIQAAIDNGSVSPTDVGKLEQIGAAAIEKFGTNAGGGLPVQSISTIAAKAATVASQRAAGLQESYVDRDLTIRMWVLNEQLGRHRGNVHLTEAGVKRAFQLAEGPMDWIKQKAGQAAGAVTNKLATIGSNLTNKVTADKLMSAWKKAGSPTDSDQVLKIMTSAGVTPDLASKAIAVAAPLGGNVIKGPAATTTTAPAPATAPAATTTPTTAPPTEPSPAATPTAAPNPFGQMTKTLGAYAPPTTSSTGGTVTQTPTGRVHQAKTNNPNAAVATPAPVKTHTGGKVAGQLSQTPNAVRKRNARSAAADNVKIGNTAPIPKQNWTGRKPTGAQSAEYQRQIHNVAESLSWSRNFNPGMTLFRQMKREQS
jgi:ribosomal protein L12E/L44/L45/RPP1/RPP2